jgi:signal transduction histidine kinase
MVVAMFEVARRRGLRSSLLACAAAIAAITAATLSRTLVQSHLSALLVPALLLVVWASWLVIPWLVGALVQVRSAAARRARQELVGRAALEERMRVASEVHDVAGHGLAAVAMQAGVALLVFDEQRSSRPACRRSATFGCCWMRLIDAQAPSLVARAWSLARD